MRKRYQNILVAWVMLYLLILFLLFNIFFHSLYKKISSTVEQELSYNLATIARVLSSDIDGEIFRYGADIYDYLIPEERIKTVLETSGVEQIFILDTMGTTVFSTDSTQKIGTVNPLVILNGDEFSSALLGKTSSSPLYRSQGEYLISVFTPVVGQFGEPTAVLGVEGGSGFFTLLGKIELWGRYLSILSILGIGLLVLSAFLVLEIARRTERSLRQAAVMTTMGEMASIMAHEIRNPLAILRGASDYLKKKFPSEKDTTRFIDEEIDRLNSIVESYLSLTRESKDAIKPETVFLGETVKSVVEKLTPEFSKNGIEIDFEMGTIPAVRISRGGLLQMLFNLLLNAKEAIGENGKIHIKTSSSGELATLEIRDTGKGIPKKEIKHIFDPFFSTKEKGSGLGLYIVKRIVENAGGKIKVESKVGSGTTVTIKLPVDKI